MTDIKALAENHIKQVEGHAKDLQRRVVATPEYKDWAATMNYLKSLRTLVQSDPLLADAPVTPAVKASQPTWAEIAIRILVEIGRPVSSRRLVAEMHKRGMQVGGIKPEVNLASILSKASSVESVRWGGRKRWWPVGRALPPQPDGASDEDSAEDSLDESSADVLHTAQETQMEPP